MQRRSFNWMALVGVALAGVVAVSAATALAARSAAGPFEIVALERYEAECPDWWTCPGGGTYVATFTSGAPFCESGTLDYAASRGFNEDAWRYTCSDGSGSLTLAEHGRGQGGEWTIVEGSGRHASLRGKGSYGFEPLSEGPPAWVYRTTLQGFADADAVAPSVAFTSASATKLRRPAGAYSIDVALTLRDDVEGNTVAYRLRVMDGAQSYPFDRPRRELDRIEGSTASGSASTNLRVYPSSKRVRNVVLLLSASDPVGNEVSLVRSLKLPR
jgi:hypothetical protein